MNLPGWNSPPVSWDGRNASCRFGDRSRRSGRRALLSSLWAKAVQVRKWRAPALLQRRIPRPDGPHRLRFAGGHDDGERTVRACARCVYGGGDSKRGLIELASGGTAFFDEIGELPLELQIKLLRVLQERNCGRSGRCSESRSNCGSIAATNRDLQAEVAAGRFREDLFHRLNVVHITLPPLRDRKEDIPLLIERIHGDRPAVVTSFRMKRWTRSMSYELAGQCPGIEELPRSA